jgi:hypothetical protein
MVKMPLPDWWRWIWIRRESVGGGVGTLLGPTLERLGRRRHFPYFDDFVVQAIAANLSRKSVMRNFIMTGMRTFSIWVPR